MKLIVVRFGSLMGGHFIANCLALHPKILHIDQKCIQQKMKRKENNTKLQSFAMSMMPIIRTLEMNMHYEYTTTRCYGFASGSHQVEQANDVWHTVMNQNEFYPCFHSGEDHDEFPNIDKINLKAVGTDWLISTRLRSTGPESPEFKNPPAEPKSLNSDNEIDFNMESIHEKQNFYNEILQLTTFLKLEPIDKELLEILRQTWMQSIRVIHKGSSIRVKDIIRRLAVS